MPHESAPQSNVNVTREQSSSKLAVALWASRSTMRSSSDQPGECASAAQMANADLRPLIDRYLPGAKGMPSEERIRIFRLAWDFAGSALASRNEQYERFYLASSGRNLARHLAFTDRSRADRLVERFLKEPY